MTKLEKEIEELKEIIDNTERYFERCEILGKTIYPIDREYLSDLKKELEELIKEDTK